MENFSSCLHVPSCLFHKCGLHRHRAKKPRGESRAGSPFPVTGVHVTRPHLTPPSRPFPAHGWAPAQWASSLGTFKRGQEKEVKGMPVSWQESTCPSYLQEKRLRGCRPVPSRISGPSFGPRTRGWSWHLPGLPRRLAGAKRALVRHLLAGLAAPGRSGHSSASSRTRRCQQEPEEQSLARGRKEAREEKGPQMVPWTLEEVCSPSTPGPQHPGEHLGSDLSSQEPGHSRCLCG